MMYRRGFLKTSLGAGALGLGFSAPSFLTRTMAATPEAGKPGSKDTVLVVLELTGGNDGLNTVVPFKDAEYAKLRPTLRLPSSDLRKITDDIALHPQLEGFAKLFQDRALCVVQGVGYPNPDQSHFRSMDIWQAASTATSLTEGWIGKALKGLHGAPSFHLKGDNERSPLALEGAPARVPSIGSLADFQLQLSASSKSDKQAQQKLIEAGVESGHGAGLLDFVQRTASNTYASSRRLQELSKNYEPKVPYPATPLANRLKVAAQLIDAGVGARIFYVALENFDTHATQAPAHANLLGTLSGAVTAFFNDLAARGQRDRVLLMTFSEFGRRAKENGSRGTDHGSAAPMFLVGGKVHPGIVGTHPSLTDLDQGNLRHKIDFRQVYATVLEKWLGIASPEVLGGKYEGAGVLRT